MFSKTSSVFFTLRTFFDSAVNFSWKIESNYLLLCWVISQSSHNERYFGKRYRAWYISRFHRFDALTVNEKYKCYPWNWRNTAIFVHYLYDLKHFMCWAEKADEFRNSLIKLKSYVKNFSRTVCKKLKTYLRLTISSCLSTKSMRMFEVSQKDVRPKSTIVWKPFNWKFQLWRERSF